MPFGKTTAVALALLLLCGVAWPLVPLLAAPSESDRNAALAAIDAWPGWRGLTAEGRAERSLPTRWSADEGIRWKTPIPGRGHSSPIVFGERVYVTTAYTATSGLLLQDVLRILTLGLVLAVATLVFRFVAERCHPTRSTWADLAAGTFMVASVLVLALIGYGGDGLFDFARCNIRGWIASAVFASVCLGLTASVTNSRRARLAIALGALLFGAFVLAAFPSKGFAFRGGLSSLRMQISIASSAIPLVIGIAVMSGGPVWLWSKKARYLAIAGVAIIVAAAGALLVRHLLIFRDDSFPAMPYTPYISPWYLALGALAIGCAWFGHRLRAKSAVANVAVVLCGAVSVVLTGVIAIEFLAVRSPYLAYQIGAPKFESPSVSVALWSAGLALVLNMAWVMFANSRVFAIMALSLGSVFFIHVNYTHTNSRMVRAIVSLDRQSGDVRWTLAGLEGPQPPIDGRNSPATPTPVTDGQRVCGYFGSAGLMCADANGRLAWSRSDLGYESYYGVGFSPVLVDGTLLVASDTSSGVARIDALDANTGASLWTHTFPTTPTTTGNNRTPIVRQIDGAPIVILWGMQYVKALALRSGEPVWSHSHTSDGDLVSSAISDGERLYLSDKAGTVALNHASLAAGRDPVRWTNTARSNCVSPVLSNGILFTVTDAGIATAIRADTGETLWRHRLPGHYFASLVASPEAVYFTNSDGLTTVVAAEETFRMIGQNDLGEATMASMAASGGALFIRSDSHIYAVGRP